MISRVLLVARMSFLEARRNRVTWAAAFFCAFVVLTSFLFQEVTIAAHDRVMRDVGFGAIHLLGVFLAIFLGVSVVTREIERRTVYAVLSKPLGRAEYLLGKLLGAWSTIAFSLALMLGALVVQTLVFNNPVHLVFVQALWLILVEMLVLVSFALLSGIVASPVVSSLTTATLFLAGHLSTPLYFMAARSESPALRLLGRALFFALPDLERLNLKGPVAKLAAAPAATMLSATAYGLAYAAGFYLLAVALFANRDLK